jgi:hypothetical protein
MEGRVRFWPHQRLLAGVAKAPRFASSAESLNCQLHISIKVYIEVYTSIYTQITTLQTKNPAKAGFLVCACNFFTRKI